MEYFIDVALNEAKKAYAEGNVPIGAAIVCNNKLIASAHNTKNTSKIAVNHAEILCIVEACKKLNSWYLNDCELFVTLKPCDMCMAAIAESRIRNVFYLLNSNYNNNLSKNREFINVESVVGNYEYSDMLKQFFIDKR